MFSSPEEDIPRQDSTLTKADRLLELGIQAGRATSERNFRSACDAFHLLYNETLGSPEHAGGASCRSLAAALNANHD